MIHKHNKLYTKDRASVQNSDRKHVTLLFNSNEVGGGRLIKVTDRQTDRQIWHRIKKRKQLLLQKRVKRWLFCPKKSFQTKDVTCLAAARDLKTVVYAAQPCSGCLTGPLRRCVSSQVGG